MSRATPLVNLSNEALVQMLEDVPQGGILAETARASPDMTFVDLAHTCGTSASLPSILTPQSVRTGFLSERHSALPVHNLHRDASTSSRCGPSHLRPAISAPVSPAGPNAYALQQLGRSRVGPGGVMSREWGDATPKSALSSTSEDEVGAMAQVLGMGAWHSPHALLASLPFLRSSTQSNLPRALLEHLPKSASLSSLPSPPRVPRANVQLTGAHRRVSTTSASAASPPTSPLALRPLGGFAAAGPVSAPVHLGGMSGHVSLHEKAGLASRNAAIDAPVSPLGVPFSALLALSARVPRSGTPLTTRQVVKAYVVPETGSSKASYLKHLHATSSSEAPGPPAAYIIHAWDSPFHRTVDALARHFAAARAPPESTLVWMDVMCVNHSAPVEATPESVETVCKLLSNVEKVLVVLDSHGTALSRTWVGFELWQASLVPSTASDRQHTERIVLINSAWDWASLSPAWATLDWGASSASDVKERALLFEAARRGGVEPGAMDALIKAALVKSAMREAQRADAFQALNLKRYLEALSVHAMVLFLEDRYGESEEVLRALKACLDKAEGSRELRGGDYEAFLFLHSGFVAREKGLLQDGVRYTIAASDLWKPGAPGASAARGPAPRATLLLCARGTQVSLYVGLRQFTKAEMLSRKLIETERQRCRVVARDARPGSAASGGSRSEGGSDSGYESGDSASGSARVGGATWGAARSAGAASGPPPSVALLQLTLQLASISSAQKIYEEAEGHIRDAMEMAAQIERGRGTGEAHDEARQGALGTAACHHMLAVCALQARRVDEALELLATALQQRVQLLGSSNPITLDTRAVMGEAHAAAGELKQAEEVLQEVYEARLGVQGPEHHSSLEALGSLADVQRRIGGERRDEAADVNEKAMLETGKTMLRHQRIDRLRSLEYISQYFSARDYLMVKAAHFLTKALLAFKERLPSDSDMIASTRVRLEHCVCVQTAAALEALEIGELRRDAQSMRVAEVSFRVAWSLSKLIVRSDEQQRAVAQGLADALFGQGKVQEAQAVMRQAGLADKGMKMSVPASYLRWLNQRVVKYMDARKEVEGEEGGGEGEQSAEE
ncbi:hypothetical protein FOA52_005397 [Chlamydomonas sp. UWO 241]|nr:hypothetical protein FOA52_005397 [Chlamydomonas sp. UWO 241]